MQAMQRAQAAVQLRQSFEDSISDDREADESLLAAYMQYIRFEGTQSPPAPARVRLLLERAVARFPVTVELWRMLTALAEGDAATAAAAAPPLADLRDCCKRATRNCPWCGELWAAQLRAVELDWDAQGGGDAAVDGSPGWELHSRLYSESLTVRTHKVACPTPHTRDAPMAWRVTSSVGVTSARDVGVRGSGSCVEHAGMAGMARQRAARLLRGCAGKLLGIACGGMMCWEGGDGGGGASQAAACV